MFLQGFIAWLNLDLGIETCFFVGLNAFLKTWLQFLFPFYIWGIAGVIIFACRYSFRLTNLIGSRAVPLLAPLFLLWRVSHLRLLKWIDKFAPVYDAYFSPLKDKHRYWFGTTLLVRGILLTVNSESVANPELKVFVLFLFIAFLCFFMSIKYVYKQMRLFESTTLLNLIVLSARTLYE